MLSLVAGVMLMICGGTPMMLSTFGQLLKRRFHYDQTQITMVQTAYVLEKKEFRVDSEIVVVARRRRVTVGGTRVFISEYP